MMQTLQQAVAKLLLLVYVPLAIALPLLHNHDVGHGTDTCLYKADGKSDNHAEHTDTCDACKFASSHSLTSISQWHVVATIAPLIVAVAKHQPCGIVLNLPSPRAPPFVS